MKRRTRLVMRALVISTIVALGLAILVAVLLDAPARYHLSHK